MTAEQRAATVQIEWARRNDAARRGARETAGLNLDAAAEEIQKLAPEDPLLAVAERIQAATGDNDEYMTWWIKTVVMLKCSSGGMDRLNELLEKVERNKNLIARGDAGETLIENPGRYMFSEICAWSRTHRVHLPPSPDHKRRGKGPRMAQGRQLRVLRVKVMTNVIKGPLWAICCDAMDGLGELGDGKGRCVVTSPPRWRLRDYVVEGWMELDER